MSPAAPRRQPKGITSGGQFAPDQHAEPEVSLTPPKPARRSAPKGSTSTLTLPDGTTVSETTSVGQYTHALVLPPEDPELVRAHREARVAEVQKQMALIDDALSGTGRNLAMQSNGFHARGEDPDRRADGSHSYEGFKVRLMSEDWETVLAQTWCDSNQMVEGTYDADGHRTQDGVQHARDYLSGQAAEQRAKLAGEADGHRRALEELDAGTYDLGGYKVLSWSGMAGNLEASVEDWDERYPTRRAYVTEVD